MRSMKKTVASSFTLISLLPTLAYAESIDGDQKTLTFMITVAIAITVVTAIVLYRAVHLKKEINLDLIDVKKVSADISKVPGTIRDKMKKISLPPGVNHASTEALSKIVEEETQRLLQDIKQEYSVKYQAAVQEKNKEVELIKKEYFQVKQQFDTIQQMYEKVDEEKTTADAVVKCVADGLVVVNQKGEVLLMNSSAEKILGVQKEKKIGRPIMDDMRDELMISLSRDAKDSGEKVIEFKSKDKNVKKILRSSNAVIQNEDGQTVGMVSILTDVTKQRELDDIKNKFVSNLTHELRTPVVAMQKAIRSEEHTSELH